MACCGAPAGDPEARAKSKRIDEMIKQDRKDEVRKVKLLLLGTGDSGKSTFLKVQPIPFSFHIFYTFNSYTHSVCTYALRTIANEGRCRYTHVICNSLTTTPQIINSTGFSRSEVVRKILNTKL